MNWLYYLLEANLYLALFYGFYVLCLRNETFYNLNRYFLLLTTAFAFILPMLQLGLLHPTVYTDAESLNNFRFPPPIVVSLADMPRTKPLFTTDNMIFAIYLGVALFFAVQLLLSFRKIIHIWIKGKKHNTKGITLVEINDETAAFSFFNMLFVHPRLIQQQEVIKHEMVHINQRHSYDVLLFEVLHVFCWFNPVVYILKKEIKLVHEYIADDLTATADVQKHDYALFLIQNSFGVRNSPLRNQIFNQSILKRRINMLNKTRTAARARLRLLLVIPLTGGMLCMSTLAFSKDYGYVDLLPEKSILTSTSLQREQVPPPPPQKAATKTAPGTKTVKFPPPIVRKDPPVFKPKEQHRFIIVYNLNSKTKKSTRLDNRYIAVNGKLLADKNKFFGAENTESVTFLNTEEAKRKYGVQFPTVELTGSNITFLDQAAPPPPRPQLKKDQIKFPPPIVIPDKKLTYFFPQYKVNGEKVEITEERYIVINGEPVADNSKFFGVEQIETVERLTPAAAVKRFGEEKGKRGAVIITGKEAKVLAELLPPPPVEPPPPTKKVLFPAPIKKSN